MVVTRKTMPSSSSPAVNTRASFRTSTPGSAGSGTSHRLRHNSPRTAVTPHAAATSTKKPGTSPASAGPNPADRSSRTSQAQKRTVAILKRRSSSQSSQKPEVPTVKKKPGTSPAKAEAADDSMEITTPEAQTPKQITEPRKSNTPEGIMNKVIPPEDTPSTDTPPASIPPEGATPKGITPAGITAKVITPEGSSPIVSATKDNITPKAITPGATSASTSPRGRRSRGSTPKGTTPKGTTPKSAGIRTRLKTGSIHMNGTTTISAAKERAELDQIMKRISKSETSGPQRSGGSTPGIGKKRASSAALGAALEALSSDHPPPKKRKIGKNDGTGEDNCNDYFCWMCHKEGTLVCCELCPRVYHAKCLGLNGELPQDWVCPECEKIMQAECVDTRSKAMEMLTLDQLCILLGYALERMKHQGSEPFLKAVDPALVPSYSDYIFHPMDLATLEKNIRKKQYGCTEALLADAKWIHHNCVIYNGAHHSLTSSAKMIVKICKHETNEIELCPDCYLNSCIRQNEEWFSEPCRVPHTLVWAKLKGYPFWPAKALREMDGQVDVRFFGAHDRSWVPVSQCFLLSKNIPTSLQKGKKNAGLSGAISELHLHIDKLRERFGGFEYAPFRTPYDKTDSYKPIDTKPSSGAQTFTFYGPKSGQSQMKKSAVSKTASALKSKYNNMSTGKKMDLTPKKIKTHRDRMLEESSAVVDENESVEGNTRVKKEGDLKCKEETSNVAKSVDDKVNATEAKVTEKMDSSKPADKGKGSVSSSIVDRLAKKMQALDEENSTCEAGEASEQTVGDKNPVTDRAHKGCGDSDSTDVNKTEKLAKGENNEISNHRPCDNTERGRELSCAKKDSEVKKDDHMEKSVLKKAEQTSETSFKSDTETTSDKNETAVVEKSSDHKLASGPSLDKTKVDNNAAKATNKMLESKCEGNIEEKSALKKSDTLENVVSSKDKASTDKETDNNSPSNKHETLQHEISVTKDTESNDTSAKEDVSKISYKQKLESTILSCKAKLGMEEDLEKEVNVATGEASESSSSVSPTLVGETDDADHGAGEEESVDNTESEDEEEGEDMDTGDTNDESADSDSSGDLDMDFEEVESEDDEDENDTPTTAVADEAFDVKDQDIQKEISTDATNASDKDTAVKDKEKTVKGDLESVIHEGDASGMNKYNNALTEVDKDESKTQHNSTTSSTDATPTTDKTDKEDLQGKLSAEANDKSIQETCSVDQSDKTEKTHEKADKTVKDVEKSAKESKMGVAINEQTIKASLNQVQSKPSPEKDSVYLGIKVGTGEPNKPIEKDKETKLKESTVNVTPFKDLFESDTMEEDSDMDRLVIDLDSENNSSPRTSKLGIQGSDVTNVSDLKKCTSPLVSEDSSKQKNASMVVLEKSPNQKSTSSVVSEKSTSQKSTGQVVSEKSNSSQPVSKKSPRQSPPLEKEAEKTENNKSQSEKNAAICKLLAAKPPLAAKTSSLAAKVPSVSVKTSSLADKAPALTQSPMFKKILPKPSVLGIVDTRPAETINAEKDESPMEVEDGTVPSNGSVPGSRRSSQDSTAASDVASGIADAVLSAPAKTIAEKFSKQLMTTIQKTLDEMCCEVLQQRAPQMSQGDLQRQLDQARWDYSAQLTELKHNFKLTLSEMQACWEGEKNKMTKQLNAKHQLELEKVVGETKKKQWCAQCGKEAIFYCCWNTSYCDYPCQQNHWPQHMRTCLQTNKDGNKTTAATPTSTVTTTQSSSLDQAINSVAGGSADSSSMGHPGSSSSTPTPSVAASTSSSSGTPSPGPMNVTRQRLQDSITAAIHREEEKRGEPRTSTGQSPKYIPMSQPMGVMPPARQGTASVPGNSLLFPSGLVSSSQMMAPPQPGMMQQIPRNMFLNQPLTMPPQRMGVPTSRSVNNLLLQQPVQTIYPVQLQQQAPPNPFSGPILFQNQQQQNTMGYGMRPPF